MFATYIRNNKGEDVASGLPNHAKICKLIVESHDIQVGLNIYCRTLDHVFQDCILVSIGCGSIYGGSVAGHVLGLQPILSLHNWTTIISYRLLQAIGDPPYSLRPHQIGTICKC